MTASHPQKSLPRRLALPVIAGAAGGFLASMAFLHLTDFPETGGLGASREIGGLVGLVYVLCALAVGLGTASPKIGARILNVENAEELREQRLLLSLSAIGMLALGTALVLLALAAPIGPLNAAVSASASGLLIVCAIVIGLRSLRLNDEMQRALSRDASATAFNLLFLIGGCWSILAHTGFADAPEPLDWLTMFAVFMLAGAFWQGARRGLMLRGPN